MLVASRGGAAVDDEEEEGRVVVRTRSLPCASW
jgi:hypothetical protein